LWPNADAGISLILAEKLRSIIENAPWTLRTITASFGIAIFASESEIADVSAGAELIEAAGKALYHAKRSGRNRVPHSDDAHPDNARA